MKRNRGAISLFALLAMMFFLIFVMVAYNNISSKGKTQIETTAVLVDEYKSKTSSSDIVKQMDGGNLTDNIVKTGVQNQINNSVNNDKYVAVDGKIYKISK